jgi:hypothetical protein
MKGEAEHLMAAIAANVPDGLARGIPARQLFLAIRRFLIDLCDIDRTGGARPSDLWDGAIEYALVEEATFIACNGAPRRVRRKVPKL